MYHSASDLSSTLFKREYISGMPWLLARCRSLRIDTASQFQRSLPLGYTVFQVRLNQ